MPRKSVTRPKIYLIIGLSIVFVVVAYFRFFHKKRPISRVPAGSNAALVRLDVPQIQIPNLEDAESRKAPVKESMSPVIRDIFAAPATPESETEIPEPEPSKQAQSLELKGTILGGEKAMAIINDKFVRTGDCIGEYRVVRIAKDEVLLSSDTHKMILKVLKDVQLTQ